MSDAARDDAQHTALRPLTAQQERVVNGIRRGLDYREIAGEMGISRRTVEGHVRAIMNILPTNVDNHAPRMWIYLWAHHRAWSTQVAAKPDPETP